MPPVADARLPWDREVDDPVVALATARVDCGDTFVVEGPEHPTLFLFSPEGVRSFYALPEATASKGVADWMMLRRKLPEELFDGRRTMPHELFGRDDVRSYLQALDGAIDVAFGELGDEGAVDALDGSAAFVHPEAMAEVAASGKQVERAAMSRVEELVGATVRERDVRAPDAR